MMKARKVKAVESGAQARFLAVSKIQLETPVTARKRGDAGCARTFYTLPTVRLLQPLLLFATTQLNRRSIFWRRKLSTRSMCTRFWFYRTRGWQWLTGHNLRAEITGVR